MLGVIRKLPTSVQAVEALQNGPFWADTRARIESGGITPILSNHIVGTLFGVQTAGIAKAWAEDIQSPLTETENSDLARVAQYLAIRIKDPVEAKRRYLEAIKGYLVALAKDDTSEGPDHVDADVVDEYMDAQKRQQVSFTTLAAQLGYPRTPDPMQNPQRLLAELPLPVYLTTSPHHFLELELAKTGSRAPETALFYWHDGLRLIPSIFDKEPDYVPSRERPLVYHLFGVDEHPESLVLTEDDYLDYLVKLATLSYEVKHSETMLDIPAAVTLALTGTALLLLGYYVAGWEFRVLFKGLVQATGESRIRRTPRSVAMQVTPGELVRRQEICDYVASYFDQSHFAVYWGEVENCMGDLYRLWKGGGA